MSISRLLITTGAALGLALLAACQTYQKDPVSQAQTKAAEQTPAPLTVSLEKGQRLSLIFPRRKEGAQADEIRQDYYSRAFSLAEPLGLTREAVLTVDAVGVGTFNPSAMILYSWPDMASEKALYGRPEWAEIKALRPGAWEDLRIATTELSDDLSLTFRPGKSYTIATAWLNPDNPDDYRQYLSNIQDAVDAAGGRFLYKMHGPDYETHSEPFAAPAQLTLVEWESPQGLAAFQKSEGFKQNAHLLGSGTNRFELLMLSPRLQ